MSETTDRLAAIRARCEASSEGPWHSGGPVGRASICKKLTGGDGPNGLTMQVFEIGAKDDQYPPALCVVNDHWDRTEDRKVSAAENAEFIAHARADIPWLLEQLAASQAREASLRDTTIRYGCHELNCPCSYTDCPPETPCACGYSAALALPHDDTVLQAALTQARAEEREALKKTVEGIAVEMAGWDSQAAFDRVIEAILERGEG